LIVMTSPNYDPRFDYYSVLEIDPSATRSEIRAAFYRAVRQVHPDLNRERKRSTRQTQRINEATILLNPVKRAEYDRVRADYRAAAQPKKAPPRRVTRRRRVSTARKASSSSRAAEWGDLGQTWVRVAEGFLRGLGQA
jgi:curved DNA-binding protein CbpA